MNKESTRETPAVVSFGDKMRFIGTGERRMMQTRRARYAQHNAHTTKCTRPA
jgi:hypothetical protein